MSAVVRKLTAAITIAPSPNMGREQVEWAAIDCHEQSPQPGGTLALQMSCPPCIAISCHLGPMFGSISGSGLANAIARKLKSVGGKVSWHIQLTL